ncbi:hypothetical protein DL764_000936 [Monosporascus ibericus]|uniref:Myb-like domain-containing protein n=1 Tax=Monosporascus ibericus TaxID=155417 RepID=A0A4Q4TV00_9PEZI|nr:hypothetical protein DL764_000936 [Monosporascus ibericus]
MGNQTSQLENPDYQDEHQPAALSPPDQVNIADGRSSPGSPHSSYPHPSRPVYLSNPSEFKFSSQIERSANPFVRVSRDAPGAERDMDPFMTQSPRDLDAPAFGTYSEEPPQHFGEISGEANDRSVTNGDPSLYHPAEPSSETSAKRGKKEKKRQRKSQVDTAQLLEANTHDGEYSPVEKPAGIPTSQGYLHGYDPVSQNDSEQLKSSKKRKRKTKHSENHFDQNGNGIDTGYEVTTNLGQLPTPDNELNARASLSMFNPELIDPALTTGPSTSKKRKTKDFSQENNGTKNSQAIKRDVHDESHEMGQGSRDQSMDQSMDSIAGEPQGEATWESSHTVKHEKKKDSRALATAEHSFGNLAQSLYADLVKSQHPESSQSDLSGATCPEPPGDEGLDVEPGDIGSKAQKNDGGEHSDGEQYQLHGDDPPAASGSEYGGDVVAKYETMSDPSSVQDFGQVSADIEMDEAVGLASMDNGGALVGHDHTLFNGGLDSQIEVPSSVPAQSNEVSIANTVPSSHIKSSTGRKRVPKQTFYDRVAEDDSQASTEHPSPSAAAASRKALAHQRVSSQGGDDEAAPSPSKPVTKAKGKQPKLSSMLGGGSSTGIKATTPASRPGKPAQPIIGPFSQFELRNINEAVDRWRKDHNMEQSQINELIQGNPKEVNSADFWATVVAACPNRKRQKVINQCRRRYHNFVARGTWTPEQDEELTEAYNKYGPKYTLIGKEINRHAEDVRDRIRNYIVCGDKRRTDAWTQEEQDNLTIIVNEAIDVIKKHQAQGQNPDVPTEDLIDWQLVSQRMDRTRSRLQCISKWKSLKTQAEGKSIDGGEGRSVDEIIVKARDEAEEMTDRERYKLTKAIAACNANAESRIPWAKVRASITGKRWTRPALMLAWRRLKLTVSDWKTMSVPDIAEQLCEQYKTTKSLEYPSAEEIDLDEEYRDIEHKVNKMLKSSGKKVKTPLYAVKSDEEDVASEAADGVGYESGDDVNLEDALQHQRGSSADLGFDMGAAKDDSDERSEVEIEDSEPEVKSQKSRNGRGDTQPTKTTRSNGFTPSKKNSGEDTPANSAKKILAGRKAKSAKRLEAAATDSDFQSSDTNASEVESIPARRPE